MKGTPNSPRLWSGKSPLELIAERQKEKAPNRPALYRSDRELKQRMEERRMDLEKDLYDKQFGENVRRYDLEYGLGEQERDRLRGVRGSGQELFDTSSSQYLQAYGAPLEELTELQEAIVRQATPGQERAMQATKTALAQQGVRGPQAALEQSRQAGRLSQNLQDALAQYALQDAQARRKERGRFLGEQALTGLERYLS